MKVRKAQPRSEVNVDVDEHHDAGGNVEGSKCRVENISSIFAELTTKLIIACGSLFATKCSRSKNVGIAGGVDTDCATASITISSLQTANKLINRSRPPPLHQRHNNWNCTYLDLTPIGKYCGHPAPCCLALITISSTEHTLYILSSAYNILF